MNQGQVSSIRETEAENSEAVFWMILDDVEGTDRRVQLCTVQSCPIEVREKKKGSGARYICGFRRSDFYDLTLNVGPPCKSLRLSPLLHKAGN